MQLAPRGLEGLSLPNRDPSELLQKASKLCSRSSPGLLLLLGKGLHGEVAVPSAVGGWGASSSCLWSLSPAPGLLRSSVFCREWPPPSPLREAKQHRTFVSPLTGRGALGPQVPSPFHLDRGPGACPKTTRVRRTVLNICEPAARRGAGRAQRGGRRPYTQYLVALALVLRMEPQRRVGLPHPKCSGRRWVPGSRSSARTSLDRTPEEGDFPDPPTAPRFSILQIDVGTVGNNESTERGFRSRRSWALAG